MREIKEEGQEVAEIGAERAEVVEKARKIIKLLTKADAGAEDFDLESLVIMIEDEELRPVIDRMLADEDISGLTEIAGISETKIAFSTDSIQLPEVEISTERDILTNPAKTKDLPDEVKAIIGDFATFKVAMDDESGVAFERFKKQLEKLRKTVNPSLLSEMLVIVAETSGEIYQFLEDYKADSWRQAVSNYEVFQDFVRGWWITQIVRIVKPKQLVEELLIVAAGASRNNAEWFLNKASRDEKEGQGLEDPPYNLKKLIGDKAFKRVISEAKQILGIR